MLLTSCCGKFQCFSDFPWMNQDLCDNDYPLSIAFNLHVFNKTRFDSRLENIVKSQCQMSLIDDVEI